MIVPRSSLSKTPLRSTHAISVIDSGFRGIITIFVDNMSNKPFSVKKGERYFQVVAPTFKSMKVKITNELSFGNRMHKGIGSSGLSKL